MKVIHLISGGDVGGAKTHVHTLLAGLCKTETVLLACFTEGPFAREARELGIPVRVFDRGMRCAISQLAELIRQEKFEIIHCHGAKANLAGSLLRKRLGLPTVSTVHSDYRLDYMGRPLAALTYGSINKIALRQMDYWIGVSDLTTNMLHERGFDPNKTFVIFNGVPFDLGEPKLDRDAYLRSVGIEPEEGMTVFGIAARISPVKDMTTLIQGFAEAVKVCRKSRLIIAGDGEQREQMEALAKQLCPRGTVVFVGWISDTHSFYSALDVNMLTSTSEGFPYALPEGASRHCATIATRVGGVPSLIDHEVNGLLFEPKDVKTLTAYMIRLASDPALVRTYADRLYQKTRERFSVDATVARQKEIYEAILRRTARAAALEKDGILICGAYGKGNSGDDAILSAMVHELRSKDPDIPIYVTTRSPKRTALDVGAGGIYTFDLPRLRSRKKKTSLYLSGGGSLIQDATSTRSLWYYLRSIRSAKKLGNQVMMFSCGIGPVRWRLNRRLAAGAINRYVDVITLRDRNSRQELEDLGVQGIPVKVTADMAFLVDPAPEEQAEAFCEANGPRTDRPWFILAPRPWARTKQYYADYANTAIYAAETYGFHPVLLAMEPVKDHPVCQEIADLIRAEGVACEVLDAPVDACMTVALIRRAEAVLGMRLHSLIFAAAQGTPFIGIAYDPKISGFLEYIGQGECCSLDEISTDRLKGMLDRLLASREGFADSARRLRALAAENSRIAFELLEKKQERHENS